MDSFMKYHEAIIILQWDNHEGEKELLWLSVWCRCRWWWLQSYFFCLTFLPETLLERHIERRDFHRSFRALENATTSQQHGHRKHLGNWSAGAGRLCRFRCVNLMLVLFFKMKCVFESSQRFLMIFANFQNFDLEHGRTILILLWNFSCEWTDISEQMESRLGPMRDELCNIGS